EFFDPLGNLRDIEKLTGFDVDPAIASVFADVVRSPIRLCRVARLEIRAGERFLLFGEIALSHYGYWLPPSLSGSGLGRRFGQRLPRSAIGIDERVERG